MTFKISIGGLGSLRKKMSEVDKAGRSSTMKAVAAAAFMIQRDAVQSIQRGPKTGHVYETRTRGGRKKTHQASAPGEAPASDTGNLARSIRVKLDKKTGAAEVMAHAPYAAWLEFGTRRFAPRPFMGPAFERNKHLVPQYLKVDLTKAITTIIKG